MSDFEVWGLGFEWGLGFGPVWGLEWGDWFVCVRVCGVQLLCVLCQLLSCSMVVVFNCVCCCSILFLLHMSRFVCNFSSS